MEGKEDKKRVVVVAMDWSKHSEYAFKCKFLKSRYLSILDACLFRLMSSIWVKPRYNLCTLHVVCLKM